MQRKDTLSTKISDMKTLDNLYKKLAQETLQENQRKKILANGMYVAMLLLLLSLICGMLGIATDAFSKLPSSMVIGFDIGCGAVLLGFLAAVMAQSHYSNTRGVNALKSKIQQIIQTGNYYYSVNELPRVIARLEETKKYASENLKKLGIDVNSKFGGIAADEYAQNKTKLAEYQNLIEKNSKLSVPSETVVKQIVPRAQQLTHDLKQQEQQWKQGHDNRVAEFRNANIMKYYKYTGLQKTK